ncbi:hypothetical protein BOA8489_03846 [Boseongicola aestuarii]|uniref:Uncharacterized protein n=1 Tax=Boseongicola aestuarii TaxID=1470561 RepID=A0A238J642_9RHOB|nr:hypothetical protein BOA8489_03846 [Boseongicola aestuarii]
MVLYDLLWLIYQTKRADRPRGALLSLEPLFAAECTKVCFGLEAVIRCSEN